MGAAHRDGGVDRQDASGEGWQDASMQPEPQSGGLPGIAALKLSDTESSSMTVMTDTCRLLGSTSVAHLST